MNLARRIDEDRRLARALLLALCLLGVLVRLPRIAAPIADAQSWNQTSAASVIRNFHEHGVDLLRPEWYHLDRGTAARKIGAEEFPLYHAVVAGLWKATGEAEWAARAVTIAMITAATLFLVLLVARSQGSAAGLLAGLVFALSPLPWFFGRAIMSDAAMLAAMVAALYSFDRWSVDGRERDFATALAATALAGLFKPFALLVGVPFLFLCHRRYGWRFLVAPRLWLFGVLALAPTILWLVHATRVGDLGGVTDKAGFLTTGKIWGPAGLLWSGEFYARLQGRLFDRAMTPVASVLALAGLLSQRGRDARLFQFWLAGVALYVLLIRNGNMEHEYYQLPYVPVAAAFAGIGARTLLTWGEARRAWTAVVAVLLAAFVALSALYVRNLYRLDLSCVRAGEIVRRVTPPGSLALVLDPGRTRKNQVIYQGRVRGWHTSRCDAANVERYRALGASRFVTVLEPAQAAANAACLATARATYPVLAREEDAGDNPHAYEVFDLARRLP